MSEALDAIKDLKEAQSEYGSTVTFRKKTKAIYDPTTYELVTPASSEDFERKMFVKSVATDKIIAKLTDNESSYSMYINGYFSEPINKDEWVVLYDGYEYAITFIDKSPLQDVIISYDILVKK